MIYYVKRKFLSFQKGNIAMWTRDQLKKAAKTTLHTCYEKSILVCLILSTFHTIMVLFYAQFLTLHVYIRDGILWHTIRFFIPAAQIPLVLILLLIGIFLINPLCIGQMHFMLSSRVRAAGINEYKSAFQKDHYGNVCKVMFATRFTIILCYLLLIIPGIYKTYQYRMVPYLLAENPKMDYHRAVYLSDSMMKGQKWKAFVLDLSFLGWNLLSLLTCTILSIVYVTPYRNHTNVGLYIMLRQKLIDLKVIDPSELYTVF